MQHTGSSSQLGLGRPPSHKRGSEASKTTLRQFSLQSTHSHLDGDAHTFQAVVDSYHQLKERISKLTDQLGSFVTECRQLGRSYALILAARDLREGLENLLSKFHDNATTLTSLSIESVSPISGNEANEPFPFWLEGVAKACDTFQERLNEFRAYTDESLKIKSAMGAFSKDLRYRAYCLEQYSDTLDTPDIRQYIHDLGNEMGNDLDHLTSVIEIFNRYGMPAMQYEQRRDTDVLLNVSTVATFFSAVTATTLQISLQTTTPPDAGSERLLEIVNTFWFCSLVLSIGAALNSLLAVIWKRTPYGSRGRRLPIWVTVWIHASAPAFLAISIATFSAGLAMFVYASNRSNHTKIVTLTTTAITSFGILTIATWFGYEQWFAPLLLPDAPWRHGTHRVHEWTTTVLASKNPTHPPSYAKHLRSRMGSLSDYSDGSTQAESISSFHIIPVKIAAFLPMSDLLTKVTTFQRRSESPSEEEGPGRQLDDVESQQQPAAPEPEDPSTTETSQEKIWSRWIRTAKLVTSMRVASKIGKREVLQRTLTSGSMVLSPTSPSSMMSPLSGSPFQMTIPEVPAMILPMPSGALQDMEYSPNGQLLAFTSFDSKSNKSSTLIYTTSSNYTLSTKYEHPGRASKQILWSSDSEKLLIRLDHSVDVLDENNNKIWTVDRPHFVESVAWLVQRNSGFLSVERSIVFELSMHGHEKKRYPFHNLLLRDVALVPGTPNLLVVTGRVMQSNVEVVPTNSRAEKQVILYDMNKEECLSRHPVLDDVRYIQVARTLSEEQDSFDILLGHRSRPAPRLWSLQPSELVLTPGTMVLQPSPELSGYGYYCGGEDQMIACVGVDGDIHIWDRESRKPAHRIPAEAVEGGMRSFAWCPRYTTQVHFASAHEKGLKIWSIEPPVAEEISSI